MTHLLRDAGRSSSTTFRLWDDFLQKISLPLKRSYKITFAKDAKYHNAVIFGWMMLFLLSSIRVLMGAEQLQTAIAIYKISMIQKELQIAEK